MNKIAASRDPVRIIERRGAVCPQRITAGNNRKRQARTSRKYSSPSPSAQRPGPGRFSWSGNLIQVVGREDVANIEIRQAFINGQIEGWQVPRHSREGNAGPRGRANGNAVLSGDRNRTLNA